MKITKQGMMGEIFNLLWQHLGVYSNFFFNFLNILILGQF